MLALIVGAATGVAGAVLRLALEQADRLRNGLITWAHGMAPAGFLIVVATCAAATMIAAWLVRRFSPHAVGSGIPHVEAVLREQLPPAPYGLVATKFTGGILAIGSGLALGREGPCVQIGASCGVFVGRISRRSWPDCRVLLAAGAGAGLAAAFACFTAMLVPTLLRDAPIYDALRERMLRGDRAPQENRDPQSQADLARTPYPGEHPGRD